MAPTPEPSGTGTTKEGPVVVGVDGSPESIAALRWAADYAERTGTGLHAVIAWTHGTGFGFVPGGRGSLHDEARRTLEHAVLEARLDAIGVDSRRERDAARELAHRALDPPNAVPALLGGGLALAGDGEHIVLELDADILGRHAREVRAQDVAIVGLHKVHRRNPPAWRDGAAASRLRIEERPEEAVQRLLQRVDLASGIPSDQCHL